MSAPVKTPRSAWITAATRALAAGGPEAVRVDVLARELGVTRGGFYGHFANRAALLEAVLDAWEEAAIAQVIAQVEAGGGDPRTKAIQAGLLTFSDELAPVDLAVREWARRDADVARRLARVDKGRLDYLRAQFTQVHPNPERAEGACVLSLAFAIGANYVAAERPPDAVIAAALEIIFTPAPGA